MAQWGKWLGALDSLLNCEIMRRKTYFFFTHGPLIALMENIGINLNFNTSHFIALNDKRVIKVISGPLSWDLSKMGKTLVLGHSGPLFCKTV